MSNEITYEELLTKIQDRSRLAEGGDNAGFALAEILPAQYYVSGHLPGAIHLPLDAFGGSLDGVLPNKDGEIVVYCASATCQNSHIAARKLASLGYANVRVFSGGKAAWSQAGQPLVTGEEPGSGTHPLAATG
ncbi:MAG: rhodanese-like domain-containing protein [Polyangiaceae bacterium]